MKRTIWSLSVAALALILCVIHTETRAQPAAARAQKRAAKRAHKKAAPRVALRNRPAPRAPVPAAALELRPHPGLRLGLRLARRLGTEERRGVNKQANAAATLQDRGGA